MAKNLTRDAYVVYMNEAAYIHTTAVDEAGTESLTYQQPNPVPKG
jgi:hypothetical protein